MLNNEMAKKYRRKRFKDDQQGMIIVEASISFLLFLLVVSAIIYLINIFIVHNRVQFAINSAAHELASYSYVYQALGVRYAEQKVQEDGNKYTKPIDETTNQVIEFYNKAQKFMANADDLSESLQEIGYDENSLAELIDKAGTTWDSGEDAIESGTAMVTDMKKLFSSPKSLLVGMIYMGASRGAYDLKSVAATAAAGALAEKYIGNGTKDADAWLKAYGVKEGMDGLDFSGSSMFCDKEKKLIDIVVQYDVDLSFLGIILPEHTIHIVQRVTVPAWLDGDGVRVEK